MSCLYPNVLVVGGAGYVGGALTDLLAETSCNLRVFDSLMYEESYRKPVPFFYGDVRDHRTLLPHLQWADAVVWLAALVGDGACGLNPDATTQINYESTKWLAENFDGRIIFMSTCSVYGAQDGLLTEDSSVNPLSHYAVTKLEAESELQRKNALVFRLGTLYGVGDLFSRIRLDLVVNILTVRAFQSNRIRIYGGEQYRPLLHVRDAAHAIMLGLQTEKRGVFNLHESNVRIIDLAGEFRRHFPNLVVDRIERKFEDTRNYRVSSDRARNELGFAPEYCVSAGIEEIHEMLSSRRLRNVDNPRYTNQAYLSLFNTHLQDDRADDADPTLRRAA